jgi:hypothetical protein
MNKRIGSRLQAQCRDHGDVQLQFFTLWLVAVFAHAVRPAARGDTAACHGALQAAVVQPQRLVGGCSTDCAAKYPCY